MQRMKQWLLWLALLGQLVCFVMLFIHIWTAIIFYILYFAAVIILIIVLIAERKKEKEEDDQNDYHNY
ncbi:hypothetical protein [Cytobacillus gottheilii]|uniref:hypothetical protein n=1 Tax=Cytobacillus gottheilii TaxID=859144 RepID=UPI00082CDB33|nr:hypothetical protein [Cytobacillus gottheilii]